MDNIIKAIKLFFETQDWNYRYNDEKKIFSTGINMNNILGNINIYIIVHDDYYNVYSMFHSTVEEKNYIAVSEYITRANYGMKSGNFELDYNDGEIRYKTFVDFENSNLSAEIIENSIFTGIAMMEKYGEGLLKIMLGTESPESCIKEIEKPLEVQK